MEKNNGGRLKKAENNGTLASYYKDYKGQYICRNCYNTIVVNARRTCYRMAEGIKKKYR